MGERSVMLAAGGTGGHLFPAYALAEEMQRRGIAVDLMTDMRGDRYGTGFPARKVYQVPSATLAARNPVAAARTVLTLARGVRAARKVMSEVRPGVVIGFGGYPSFPPLIAASMKGIPTALHEQNAVLGRANRMLAKRVTVIATSFEHTKLLDGAAVAKARFTGNPVREAVVRASEVPYQPLSEDGLFRLVVFGGSQGARFFSEVVPPALVRLPEELRQRLAVIQQCREEDLAGVREAYDAAGIRAHLATFFRELPELMSWSQLVIGRAGASSVAELTVLGRPSILVPLPHALDNDQLNNALQLAESGACWCIEQKDVSPDSLADGLHGLMTNPEALTAAALAAKARGRPDAVARLADLVEGLLAGRGLSN